LTKPSALLSLEAPQHANHLFGGLGNRSVPLRHVVLGQTAAIALHDACRGGVEAIVKEDRAVYPLEPRPLRELVGVDPLLELKRRNAQRQG
jgi:hypothetical protein